MSNHKDDDDAGKPKLNVVLLFFVDMAYAQKSLGITDPPQRWQYGYLKRY